MQPRYEGRDLGGSEIVEVRGEFGEECGCGDGGFGGDEGG